MHCRPPASHRAWRGCRSNCWQTRNCMRADSFSRSIAPSSAGIRSHRCRSAKATEPFADPLGAADARRAQSGNTRWHARAVRRRDRPAGARRDHRHRDADGGTTREREEAGGGLMETVHPAERKSGAAAAGSQPALMSVRGLGIRFKTAQGIWQATRKIDFDIAPGERVGIVGESGCGKTITGLSILRLLPNNLSGLDGSILFDGVDLARAAPGHARHTRPPHRDDLSGADERARSGVHGRPPDRRDAAGSYRRQQGGGAGADHRDAAPRRHRLARAARSTNIRISSPAACASA